MRPLKPVEPISNFTVSKWKRTRFWAIHHKGGQLVALCAYRKGARQLVPLLDRLIELERKLEGLHLIQDLVEQVPAQRIADRPRR